MQIARVASREVSIHAPLARSNASICLTKSCNMFQYMLLLRGATGASAPAFRLDNCFNTCSSCEEQQTINRTEAQEAVSIHAPLARSNKVDGDNLECRRRFNTCSSCEEQQIRGVLAVDVLQVSIHAPLARSNVVAKFADRVTEVSIHAPLARSNSDFCRLIPISQVSIHAPLARSNRARRNTVRRNNVSIHAPLARSN